MVLKPVTFDNIDKELFLSNLSEMDMRCDGPEDVHEIAFKISESLYMSAASSRASPVRHRDGGGQDRWARLLSDPDDRRVFGGYRLEREIPGDGAGKCSPSSQRF